MEKVVKIKIDGVEYIIPESAIANYPHLKLALQQQGSKEKPQTETQKLSSGTEIEVPVGSEEVSEQTSPRRTQRRGI